MGGIIQGMSSNIFETATQTANVDYFQIEQRFKELIESLEKINNTLSHPNISWVDRGSFFVSLGTIFLLYIYTRYTYKIAKANEELLRPSISYSLVSGKSFYRNATIEQFYDTRFILKNHSKYDVLSYVRLNLKADGKKIGLDERAYHGKKSWFLFPEQEINGHFVIPESHRSKKITVEIEVDYGLPPW